MRMKVTVITSGGEEIDSETGDETNESELSDGDDDEF